MSLGRCDRDQGVLTEIGKIEEGNLELDYRNLLQEENEAVRERYVLAAERIRQIAGEQECDVVEPYRTYFQRTSAFLVQMQKLLQDNDKHRFDGMTLEELQAYNR